MGKVFGTHYFAPRQTEGEYRYKLWQACRETDSIFKAYAEPSYAKQKAYWHCESICYDVGGTKLCITGHNCFHFTASFVTLDKETGKPNRVFWITHASHYYADIKE